MLYLFYILITSLVCNPCSKPAPPPGVENWTLALAYNHLFVPYGDYMSKHKLP